MVEEGALRHLVSHDRKHIHSMVHIHLHMPAINRKHMEAANLWKPEMPRPPPYGRNDDLGDLRQPAHRPPHLPDPVHHCTQDDERTHTIETGGTCRLHV